MKTRKCGDPYQYPIPKPNGDPWDIVLEPYLKEDRTKCDAWKDEVQTLLIFAGLFSAVVTAFVAQSYQALQVQDNSNIVLLARMANRLDGFKLGNLTESTPSSDPSQSIVSEPTASSIRINILWFLSLILSLTTVLFGIIALQWIREHQRESYSVKSRKALAMFRMRSEALEAWYVPQLFTGLPLLLQTSLVLFFVGIVDFLFSLNYTVAIPVTVLVILTLLFIVVTTILPTLQLVLLANFNSSTKGAVPAQCPYKSPQSWAFHRLSKWIFHNGYTIFLFFRSRPKQPSERAISQLPLQIFLDSEPRSWITFDSHWLKIRDVHFQLIQGLFTPSFESMHPRRPMYDETCMLISIIQDHPSDNDIFFAAYHCFHELSRNVLYRDHDGEDGSRPPQFRRRNELLRRYFQKIHPHSSEIPMSDMIKEPDSALLHDENMASFIWLLGRYLFSGSQSDAIRMHLFELQSRMLAHVFAEAPQPSSNKPAHNKRIWSGRICDQYKLFEIQSTFTENVPSIPNGVIQDLVEQYFTIFHSFIEVVASTKDEEIMQTMHGQELMLLDFLKVPSYLHRYISNDPTAPNSAYSVFKSSIQLLISLLERSLTREREERVDFLFFCACLFARDYPEPDSSFDAVNSDLIVSLMTALIKYEQILDKDRFLALFEPLCPWSIHSCFDSERRVYSFAPLHRMPIYVREEIVSTGILQQENKVDKRTLRRKTPEVVAPPQAARPFSVIPTSRPYSPTC